MTVLKRLGSEQWVAVVLAALPLFEASILLFVRNGRALKSLSNLCQVVAAAAVAAVTVSAARKLHREGNESTAAWRLIAVANCI